jgi:hypothetical protein
MSVTRWRCGIVLVAALAVCPLVVRAADSGPTAVVNRFDETLIGVMKDGESLGYEGRFKRLQPVMQEAFALDYMAEKSLGQHWSELSDADRATWRQLFAEFTIANYAANFDRFTGQRFDMLGEEASTTHGAGQDQGGQPRHRRHRHLTYRLRRSAVPGNHRRLPEGDREQAGAPLGLRLSVQAQRLRGPDHRAAQRGL